jgi:hypothetical protein
MSNINLASFKCGVSAKLSSGMNPDFEAVSGLFIHTEIRFLLVGGAVHLLRHMPHPPESYPPH